ncbi:hypothetical protein BJY59DRAFT_166459 [Rhodotorula toruloides]
MRMGEERGGARGRDWRWWGWLGSSRRCENVVVGMQHHSESEWLLGCQRTWITAICESSYKGKTIGEFPCCTISSRHPLPSLPVSPGPRGCRCETQRPARGIRTSQRGECRGGGGHPLRTGEVERPSQELERRRRASSECRAGRRRAWVLRLA